MQPNQTITTIIKKLPGLLKELFSFAPLPLTGEYFFSLLDAVTMVLGILTLNNFFTSLQNYASGMIPIKGVIVCFLIFIGVRIGNEIFNGVSNLLGEYVGDLARGKHILRLHQKCTTIPAIYFEETKNVELLTQAYQGAYYIRKLLHVFMDMLFLYAPYFLFLSVLLIKINPYLLWIIPFAFIPTVLTHIFKGKISSDTENALANLVLHKNHFLNVLTEKQFLKDTFIYQLRDVFLEKLGFTQEQMAKITKKGYRKSKNLDAVGEIFSNAGYISIIILLVGLTASQKITIASFAAILANCDELFSLIDEILSYRLGEISESMGKISKYFNFLEQDLTLPEITAQNQDHKLTVKNISFKYPSNPQNTLKNISFEINKGDCVVVVGRNGSGKTTLGKILLGLYAPSAGEVLYPKESKLQETPFSTALFQEYNKHYLTLSENVSLSDIQRPAGAAQIRSCLEKTGFFENSKQNQLQLDSQMGREFGGKELSEGQWQRVALARCMFRNGSVAVFDEPTSAIDPVEEDHLFFLLKELAQGRCAVIISHRLGITRLADVVLVMRDGELVGCGTHDFLLKTCPPYQDLWGEFKKPSLTEKELAWQ